jgi:putative transposase
LDPELERVNIYAYQIYKSGPVILEKIIKTHYGRTIPYNTIYRMMLMHQLAIENPPKKGQMKRVRFERKHSMSLWQGDGEEFESMDRKNGLLPSSGTQPG